MMPKIKIIFLLFVILALGRYESSIAQNGRFSEIVVHIWGEVNQPGEYRVPAGTDVLGLISKAGGPTEFSNLRKVRLTRTLGDVANVKNGIGVPVNGTNKARLNQLYQERFPNARRVVPVDIDEYLKMDQKMRSLPLLLSNDVVHIPRNSWSRWKSVAAIVRDVAILANVYFWFRQASKN